MLDNDVLLEDKPLADVVDQHLPARPDDDTPDDLDASAVAWTAVLEADPADVIDQRRLAPVFAEDDLWP